MKQNYSVSEAAKLLGYSTNSVYGFLKDDLIKSKRIGKGKFRIPKEEIDRFAASRGAENGAVPESAILPLPRPGKSLANLSGESTIHTLRLWLEERVGLPRLFDWLTSLTALILGVSLFLYSSQTDILSSGRLVVWMDPIRLTLIFGGVGLILASMVQTEVGKKINLVNLFRFMLTLTMLGLASILLSGGDVDGFMIYGLFGLIVLVEALTEIDTAVMYMFYIFGLIVGIFAIYKIFPGGSGLSVIASSLINVFSFYNWILTVLMVVLIILGLYGYLWNRKFLNTVVMIYGFLLCALSLFYGAGNYWSRAFVLLMAGMIGLILPSWGKFRVSLEKDRLLVFKMFGFVLICFAIPIMLVAVVQGTLINNADRNLRDKADYANMQLTNIFNNSVQGATDLANNPGFITAFVHSQTDQLTNQIRFLSLGNNEVILTEVINSKGKAVAVYPLSSVYSTTNYAQDEFFKTVMGTGNNYISRNLESLGADLKEVLLVAVPAVDSNNTVSGVILTVLSGVNLTNYLQEISERTLGQEVVVAGDGAKTIIYPNVEKLGIILNEGDTSYDIWKNGLMNAEGYNWNGVHSVFGASANAEYGMTTIFSQPIRKVLDVSTSWLAWLLFIQLIVGMVVFMSFIYIKKTQLKKEI
jgi:excisionase family DNA binding protein